MSRLFFAILSRLFRLADFSAAVEAQQVGAAFAQVARLFADSIYGAPASVADGLAQIASARGGEQQSGSHSNSDSDQKKCDRLAGIGPRVIFIRLVKLIFVALVLVHWLAPFLFHLG